MTKLVYMDPLWIDQALKEEVEDPDDMSIAPKMKVLQEERRGVGLSFSCPCSKGHEDFTSSRVIVFFENPVDGGAPLENGEEKHERSGTDFRSLTISGVVENAGPCGWRGRVVNGDVLTEKA